MVVQKNTQTREEEKMTVDNKVHPYICLYFLSNRVSMTNGIVLHAPLGK